MTEQQRALLRSALEQSPQRGGYPASGWTIPLLQDYLKRMLGQKVYEDTLRRQLHAWRYVWKRFRYVLVADPDLEKKTADLLQIKALQPQTALLSEDETRPASLPSAEGRVDARRPAKRRGPISGADIRRVLFGCINIRTGHRLGWLASISAG